MSSTDSMRAGIFLDPHTIETRQTPVPTPHKGEVLLKVLACGVCGTDYHIFEGELTDGIFPPVVLGHEIATRLEAVGQGVEGLEPGQFCAVDPLIGCGRCRMCQAGKKNLCPQPTIIGYKRNGGFAQYMTLPASNVIALDESVGLEGAVLCETLACIINGYDRLEFSPASSAMVLGAGAVGLLWAQLLTSSPCRKLLQTELADFRCRKARQLGADVVINPEREDLEERVRDELPAGVDFIIDATGSPEAVEQALPLLAAGGTFMIFGVCPQGSRVRLDPYELYNKEAKLVASKMPPNTLHRAARLVESGRIACEQIVTASLPLDSLAQAVEAFTSNRETQLKVAIDPWT